MVVRRSLAGAPTGEDVEDLRDWLRTLPGSPAVHEVAVLACGGAHGDDAERPVWAYVEADASAGLARRRCLACGTSVSLLDSAERWTHPPMHACGGCSGSIVEVAAGLHLPDGEHVSWVVVGVRCVDCGRLTGVTDMLLDPTPVADVLSRL